MKKSSRRCRYLWLFNDNFNLNWRYDMEPIKPFAFMIISLFLGALPFTALFFIWWIVVLINNISVGK